MENELLISAKPIRRIAAFLFDALLNIGVSLIVMIPSILAFIDICNYPNPGYFRLFALFVASVISGALMIAITIFYFVCLPVIWEGQTVGKRLLKIRIIDVTTNEGPSSKTMFLRETFRIVIFVMTFGLSGIASLLTLCLSSKHTTFHEQLSSTRVVNVNMYLEERHNKHVDVN